MERFIKCTLLLIIIGCGLAHAQNSPSKAETEEWISKKLTNNLWKFSDFKNDNHLHPLYRLSMADDILAVTESKIEDYKLFIKFSGHTKYINSTSHTQGNLTIDFKYIDTQKTVATWNSCLIEGYVETPPVNFSINCLFDLDKTALMLDDYENYYSNEGESPTVKITFLNSDKEDAIGERLCKAFIHYASLANKQLAFDKF